MIPLSLVEEQLVRTPARSIDTGGETWRRAAVAAVFRAAGGDTEILFVRRAAQKKDPWSRQVGFPGGHEEEGDDDLVASAARETLEEVGIDVMDGGRLLGSLDVLQARARSKIYPMSIHPYAFVLDTDTDRPLIPNPAEVDRAFWVPLSRLANPGHRVWYDAQRVGVPFSFPAIDVDAGDVPLWGLTHHMVLEILHRLGVVADVSALTMPRPIPK